LILPLPSVTAGYVVYFGWGSFDFCLGAVFATLEKSRRRLFSASGNMGFAHLLKHATSYSTIAATKHNTTGRSAEQVLDNLF